MRSQKTLASTDPVDPTDWQKFYTLRGYWSINISFRCLIVTFEARLSLSFRPAVRCQDLQTTKRKWQHLAGLGLSLYQMTSAVSVLLWLFNLNRFFTTTQSSCPCSLDVASSPKWHETKGVMKIFAIGRSSSHWPMHRGCLTVMEGLAIPLVAGSKSTSR